ncbi:alpha/beta hydrolase [Nocardia fluminea]|uniref:alpha/beta hydrolase n=1 Tax=Nocardia fluminea TaxID=134984 RepID=UPI00147636E5|nr:alpha/beta fold hydrolase [Nocardia fluminea]
MLVVDEGEPTAPAIVFLHGIPGSVDWFAAVAERMVANFRVIRVDMRELGTDGDFGAAARTAPVLALMDDLDLTDVTVVGHSFGAEIALELAAASRRIARVVVVGQAPDYRAARIPAADPTDGEPRTSRWSCAWTRRRGFCRNVPAGAGLSARRRPSPCSASPAFPRPGRPRTSPRRPWRP